MDVIITNHALDQYCIRVEDITRDELSQLLTEQLLTPYRRKRDLVQLDGVWWVYVNQTFITCYGRSHLDLPKAIGWAVRNNDRIKL